MQRRKFQHLARNVLRLFGLDDSLLADEASTRQQTAVVEGWGTLEEQERKGLVKLDRHSDGSMGVTFLPKFFIEQEKGIVKAGYLMRNEFDKSKPLDHPDNLAAAQKLADRYNADSSDKRVFSSGSKLTERSQLPPRPAIQPT